MQSKRETTETGNRAILKKLKEKWSLVLTAITASDLKIKSIYFFPYNCFCFMWELMTKSARAVIAMDSVIL